MSFYFKEQIQMKIKLYPIENDFSLFVFFENIMDKMSLAELNSKSNYSIMLIQSLSHQLGTPLHQLNSIAERLVRKEKMESDKNLALNPSKFLKNSANKAMDANKILMLSSCLSLFVQNILDFANIMNDSFGVNPESFEVKPLLDELMLIFDQKADQKGISITQVCEDKIQMFSDRRRLKGILFNLLDNAIKFSLKGKISLTARSLNNKVLFEIMDEGVGMDNRDLIKLSEIFADPFLADKTKSSAGLGIGLRISQALLRKLSGGKVFVEVMSEKEGGTTVRFKIQADFRTVEQRKETLSLNSKDSISRTQSVFKEKAGPKSKQSLQKNKVEIKSMVSGKALNRFFAERKTQGFKISVSLNPDRNSSKSPSRKNLSVKKRRKTQIGGGKTFSEIEEEEIFEEQSNPDKFFDDSKNSKEKSPFLEPEPEYGDENGLRKVYSLRVRPEFIDEQEEKEWEESFENSDIEEKRGSSDDSEDLNLNSKTNQDIRNAEESNSHSEEIFQTSPVPASLSSPSPIIPLQPIVQQPIPPIQPISPSSFQPFQPLALIVDDETINLEIASDCLSDMGLQVLSAQGPSQAIATCRHCLQHRLKLKVVFMDFSMPNMTGDRVVEIMKGWVFEPVVEGCFFIGLTAHSDEVTKKKCLKAGMDRVEAKPFNFRRIQALLKEIKVI